MTNKRRDDAVERVLNCLNTFNEVKRSSSDGAYAIDADAFYDGDAIYIINVADNVETIEEMTDEELIQFISRNKVEDD